MDSQRPKAPPITAVAKPVKQPRSGDRLALLQAGVDLTGAMVDLTLTLESALSADAERVERFKQARDFFVNLEKPQSSEIITGEYGKHFIKKDQIITDIVLEGSARDELVSPLSSGDQKTLDQTAKELQDVVDENVIPSSSAASTSEAATEAVTSPTSSTASIPTSASSADTKPGAKPQVSLNDFVKSIMIRAKSTRGNPEMDVFIRSYLKEFAGFADEYRRDPEAFKLRLDIALQNAVNALAAGDSAVKKQLEEEVAKIKEMFADAAKPKAPEPVDTNPLLAYLGLPVEARLTNTSQVLTPAQSKVNAFESEQKPTPYTDGPAPVPPKPASISNRPKTPSSKVSQDDGVKEDTVSTLPAENTLSDQLKTDGQSSALNNAGGQSDPVRVLENLYSQSEEMVTKLRFYNDNATIKDHFENLKNMSANIAALMRQVKPDNHRYIEHETQKLTVPLYLELDSAAQALKEVQLQGQADMGAAAKESQGLAEDMHSNVPTESQEGIGKLNKPVAKVGSLNKTSNKAAEFVEAAKDVADAMQGMVGALSLDEADAPVMKKAAVPEVDDQQQSLDLTQSASPESPTVSQESNANDASTDEVIKLGMPTLKMETSVEDVVDVPTPAKEQEVAGDAVEDLGVHVAEVPEMHESTNELGQQPAKMETPVEVAEEQNVAGDAVEDLGVHVAEVPEMHEGADELGQQSASSPSGAASLGGVPSAPDPQGSAPAPDDAMKLAGKSSMPEPVGQVKEPKAKAPSNDPIPPQPTATEAEQKAKRDAERIQWLKIYRQANGLNHRQYRRVDKLGVDPQGSEMDEKAGLVSVDPNLPFKPYMPGVYKENSSSPFYFKVAEGGRVTALLDQGFFSKHVRGKGVKSFSEWKVGMAGAIDACVHASPNATTVRYDVKHVDEKYLAAFMKIASEKNMVVEFGPNVQAYLDQHPKLYEKYAKWQQDQRNNQLQVIEQYSGSARLAGDRSMPTVAEDAVSRKMDFKHKRESLEENTKLSGDQDQRMTQVVTEIQQSGGVESVTQSLEQRASELHLTKEEVMGHLAALNEAGVGSDTIAQYEQNKPEIERLLDAIEKEAVDLESRAKLVQNYQQRADLSSGVQSQQNNPQMQRLEKVGKLANEVIFGKPAEGDQPEIKGIKSAQTEFEMLAQKKQAQKKQGINTP